MIIGQTTDKLVKISQNAYKILGEILPISPSCIV